MSNELNNLSTDEAITKINAYRKLVKYGEYEDDVFEDATAFSGIKNFPARSKCANLG